MTQCVQSNLSHSQGQAWNTGIYVNTFQFNKFSSLAFTTVNTEPEITKVKMLQLPKRETVASKKILPGFVEINC